MDLRRASRFFASLTCSAGSWQPSAKRGSRTHSDHCSKLPRGRPRLIPFSRRLQRQIVRAAARSSDLCAFTSARISDSNSLASGSSTFASSSTVIKRRARSSETVRPLPVKMTNAEVFSGSKGSRSKSKETSPSLNLWFFGSRQLTADRGLAASGSAARGAGWSI
jgi:hypothetical protein